MLAEISNILHVTKSADLILQYDLNFRQHWMFLQSLASLVEYHNLSGFPPTFLVPFWFLLIYLISQLQRDTNFHPVLRPLLFNIPSLGHLTQY